MCAQAARSLPDTGWPVRVIEARDRIGGRVHIDRDWGVPLEMGGDGISPVQIRTSRWNLDPCARRVFPSTRRALAPTTAAACRNPFGDRLYLAGEAVGVDDPASMHGAVLSGRYAATRLMRRLGA